MSTLSCEEIRERLADGDEDATLIAHAKACESCRPILAALSEIDGELAALPELDAPDALVARTIAAVKQPETPAPSLLAAAFAVLTSAIGALVTAPLVALRWLLGVGSERSEGASRAAEARRERGAGWRGPTFAFASVLIAIVGVMTFQTFGSTVKTKTRGAEAVVNALPVASDEETAEPEVANGWWAANTDLPAGSTAAAPTPPAEPADDSLRQLAVLGYATGGDSPTLDRQQGQASLDSLTVLVPERPAPAFGQTGEGSFERGELLEGEVTETEHESWRGAGPSAHGSEVVVDESRLEVDGRLARDSQHAEPPTGTPSHSVTTPRIPPASLALQVPADTDRADRGGRWLESDGDDDGVRAGLRAALPSAWDVAHATTGLTFRSSQSWWANTYVPGDASLRMLHARLAASSAALPGGTLSALALAETASPTAPSIAAPTDRALAIGVHADTTAIEGPTRVRVEIALRAIDQAAGRRGALRVALVVDARSGLGTEESDHLRALCASLSRSLSPRDRVIVTAAGSSGGTLVPLGVLRHGQVEVALRHLTSPPETTVDAPATSLADALAAGLEAVSTDDDGAGLVLLVTPDGAHDASVDQALHLGAVAGVPTTAVGIGTAASTSSLDAIALAGEGRRRMVLSDDDATRAVREELVAASRLVARALRVRVRLADGVQLVDVVGSHALDAEETRRTRESERAIDQSLARRLGIAQDRDDDDSGVRVLVPSFYAGDAHTIVLDLLVTRPGPVADVDVRFKDLVRLGNGTASSALALEAGTATPGPRELRVVSSWLGQEVAAALDEAADRLEAGDVDGASTRLAAIRTLLTQAEGATPGLASVTSVRTDGLLVDRFLAALSGGDRGLVASSLHYAAARRVVVPQLQASVP